jgi:drug/metabolite transporter (DMT)-like permease
MLERNTVAYVLLTLTTVFWAGNWVVARGIQGYMSPVGMAFWRWFAALLILLPFAALPMWRELATIRRSWKPLALLGFLGVSAFNTLTYMGLKYTTATNGVLLNSVSPVLIIAISVVFLREPLSARQLAGVMVSFAGVVAIVGRGSTDVLLALEVNPGDLLVLAAMAGWAVYTICLRWRPPELSSLAFTGTLITIGVVLLLPLHLWDYAQGPPTQWGALTVGAIAYFAIFASVLAYFFWNAAVERVGAARAGAFLHLIPLFGAALSWLLLGEALYWYHYLGAALVFTGIFVASQSGWPRLRAA